MEATRIGKRVYADTSGEGRGNIGAIELPNCTIVIDSTISTETAKAFRKSLEAQTKSPIRKLILTHYHSDHTNGLQIFEDCQIIASKPLKKLRKAVHVTKTFEKTLTFKDEDVLVIITHASGHTEDSTYIYLPIEKTLFSGDLIFAKSFFYTGDPTFNPEKWMNALKSFTKMEVETIIPGHGPICGMEEVEIYIKFFEKTSSIMRRLVQQGIKAKEAVGYAGFPDFYPPYRKGVRELAIANWYKFYKQKAVM